MILWVPLQKEITHAFKTCIDKGKLLNCMSKNLLNLLQKSNREFTKICAYDTSSLYQSPFAACFPPYNCLVMETCAIKLPSHFMIWLVERLASYYSTTLIFTQLFRTNVCKSTQHDYSHDACFWTVDCKISAMRIRKLDTDRIKHFLLWQRYTVSHRATRR